MVESLEELDRKINTLKSKIINKPTTQTVVKNSGSYVIIELVVSIAIATFIGYQLDIFFKTKVLFLFIFIILGLVSSIYNIYRKLK